MPDTVPAGVDTNRPNIALIYDYWLGGKDNFAVDREQAERSLELCPGLRQWARKDRAFVCGAAARAAREAGIGQFLDLGAGLPTHPAVHEAVRAVDRPRGWRTWTSTAWRSRMRGPCWRRPLA